MAPHNSQQSHAASNNVHHEVDVGDVDSASAAGHKNNPPMQILVKLIGGRTTLLDVAPHHTVLDVKAAICARDGLPIEAQRLICSGRLLVDARTLHDSGVRDCSTCYVVIPIRGGMPRSNRAAQAADASRMRARLAKVGAELGVAASAEVTTVSAATSKSSGGDSDSNSDSDGDSDDDGDDEASFATATAVNSLADDDSRDGMLAFASTFDPFAEVERSTVHVRLVQRSGRRWHTFICGLGIDLDLRKIARLLQRACHTNGTVLDDEVHGGRILQLQGDQRKLVVAALVEWKIVESRDCIKVYGA